MYERNITTLIQQRTIISSTAEAAAAAEKKKRGRLSGSKDKYPRKKVDTCTNNATTAASTNDTKLHGTQI